MDTIAAERWTFPASLGDDRLRALAEPPSFPAIVELIRESMRVLCCHPESCDIAQGFERIIYCVRVERGLFDLFFNSRAGYRAAYYLSPYKGLEANTQAIDALTPVLIVSNATNGQRTNQFIEESLHSPPAKIWLAEPERGFCSLCSGEWSNPTEHDAEIMNGRWECSSYDNAVVKGRKAPFFEKLRIFGAFLNAGFDEIVPERKRYRAQHIHKWGWA